jgi:hypothetical protein
MTADTPAAGLETDSRTFTVDSKVDDRSPLRQSVFHQPRDGFLADLLMRNEGFIQT